jgi:hypothetical protein
MITNAGRVMLIKSLMSGKVVFSGIAIGDGANDPILNAPIAPSPDATSLKHQYFFDPRIQLLSVTSPGTGIRPRLFVKHTFENSLVPPTGSTISSINEVGLFVIDPETNQNVLFAIKSFQSRLFRVPATGSATVRDSFTCRWELM